MVVETRQEGMMTDRIAKLRRSIIDSPIVHDVERLKFLMEVYPKTDGESPIMRQAKVFDKVCSCKTIYLDENPIAGTVGRGRNYVYAYPEFSCDWMADESNYATYRGAVGFREEERGLINQTVDYWRDRCEEAISRRMYDSLHPGEPDAATMFPGYPTLATTVAAFAYRFSMPDYYTILNKGLNWLIAVAEEKLSKVVVWDLGNLEARSKYDFYRAVILSLKAVIKLAQRYASMAREKAEVEADPERRLELLRMAEACEWVPANPARNFFEAVQSVWFIMLTSLIEEEGCGVQPWRFSQFMYPFYKKDVDEGRITREQAIELLEFFFLKIKETYFMTPVVGLAANGGQTSKYFSLGGLTADGKDATNEIDYLILETQRRLRLPEPAITVFYHDKMPEDFLHECVKLIRTGIGQPQFKNNDVAVQRELYHQQCSLEEAREVSTVYCVSVALPKSSAVCFGGPFNLAKVIELTLNNGRNPGDGIQMGPKTGEVESFTSWDKFYAAFREQLSYLMLRHREYNLIELNTVAELYPVPFRSAVHNDCLERGLSLDAGGAKYYTGGPLFTAGIDAANSLTAIKKLVYEEKKITLKKLKEALDANFEGYEEIQRMCLDAPKYGNDDDYGDKMARQVWDLVYDVYKGSPLDHNRKGSRPEPYSIALHNFFGYITGALPTGRKAGTALTDASVSPMPGTDLNGPTALAKSAAGAMDTVKYGTSHLNMRFHPSALEGEKGARALISLIKTYMQMGGDHIQFNCISTETLRDAQVHSENYADLVVRVAGFSAFYVHLDKGIQDEIIKRTELGFG